MSGDFREVPGVSVELERVVYQPGLETPAEKPHPFVYFIAIRNQSDETVTIQGRKWILRDERGELVVVEGRGVVGHTPELKPGDYFSYNSYHVIARDSEVTGSFFGVDQSGQRIRVSIPRFHLKIPAPE